MSDIKRYTKYDLELADEPKGEWVKYNDYEDLRRDALRWKEGYLHMKSVNSLEYKRGYNVALRDAANAVALCKTHIRRRNTRKWGSVYRTSSWSAVKFITIDKDDALKAISALKEKS